MAKDYDALSEHLRAWIGRQHIFFTATAAPGTRVNLSPRSTDWLRVVSDNAVVYLDRTGSGNETSAHTRAGGPMTIMMCAFEGPPLILRLYGRGTIIARDSEGYAALLAEHFDGAEPIGARQMVRLDFDLVKTSCGFAVPTFEHTGERNQLDRWAEAKGPEGLVAYRREFNVTSMDGLATGFAVQGDRG